MPARTRRCWARDFDIGTFRRVVDTNLMGTVNCLAPVMERFRSRRIGHIAVVGSVAGYVGLPTAAAYAPSKAGVIAMCEALRPELAGRRGEAFNLSRRALWTHR